MTTYTERAIKLHTNNGNGDPLWVSRAKNDKKQKGEKNMKSLFKSKKVLTISLIVLIVLAVSCGVVAYAASLPKTTRIAQSPANPEDAVAYIQSTDNDIGGKEYSWVQSNAGPVIPRGTIRIYDGYMYVYGYYYSGTETSGNISTTSLSSWTAMAENNADYGWGCALINKDATTASNPKGILGYYSSTSGYNASNLENMANESITGEPVTYFNRAFSNCTKLTEIPIVPTVAKHTDEIFLNCTALTKVSVNCMSVLGKNAFKGCSNLTRVYLGKQVTSFPYGGSTNGAFVGVKSTCKIYCEVSSKPSGWNSSWYSGITNNSDHIIWDADYLIMIAKGD